MSFMFTASRMYKYLSSQQRFPYFVLGPGFGCLPDVYMVRFGKSRAQVI